MSVFSGIAQANATSGAADTAAKSQIEAAKIAAESQEKALAQARTDFAPYLQAGVNGLVTLENTMPNYISNVLTPIVEAYAQFEPGATPDPMAFARSPLGGPATAGIDATMQTQAQQMYPPRVRGDIEIAQGTGVPQAAIDQGYIPGSTVQGGLEQEFTQAPRTRGDVGVPGSEPTYGIDMGMTQPVAPPAGLEAGMAEERTPLTTGDITADMLTIPTGYKLSKDGTQLLKRIDPGSDAVTAKPTWKADNNLLSQLKQAKLAEINATQEQFGPGMGGLTRNQIQDMIDTQRESITGIQDAPTGKALDFGGMPTDLAAGARMLKRAPQQQFLNPYAAGQQPDVGGALARTQQYLDPEQRNLIQFGQGVKDASPLQIGFGDYTSGEYAPDVPELAGMGGEYAFDENDPVYMQRKKEANERIDRFLSGKGLLGSSAGEAFRTKEMDKIFADEESRQYGRFQTERGFQSGAAQTQYGLQAERGRDIYGRLTGQQAIGLGREEQLYNRLRGQQSDIYGREEQLAQRAQQGLATQVGLEEQMYGRGQTLYQQQLQQAQQADAQRLGRMQDMYGMGKDIYGLEYGAALDAAKMGAGAAGSAGAGSLATGQGIAQSQLAAGQASAQAALQSGQALSDLYGNMGQTASYFYTPQQPGGQSAMQKWGTWLGGLGGGGGGGGTVNWGGGSGYSDIAVNY